jgi:hypothetical protein
LSTLSGEILINGKSHKQKQDGLFPKEDSEIKKVVIPFV